MPKLLDDITRGRILQCRDFGMKQYTISRKFRVSLNSVRALLRGKSRRTDMDKRRKKQSVVAQRRALRRRKVAKLASTTKIVNGRKMAPFGSARKIRVELHRQNPTEAPPSESTIARDLKQMRFTNYVRPSRPFSSEKHLKRRVAFAKQARWKDRSVFRRVVFSDESKDSTNDHTIRTQWVRSKAHLLPREKLNPLNVPNVHFWASCGFGFKGPILFIRRVPVQEAGKPRTWKLEALTQERYCEHYLSHIVGQLRRQNRLFMHDGARAHAGKKTQAYLARKRVDFIVDWPANSPDLNPIENIWAELKRRRAEKGPARDEAHLRQQLEEAWAELPQSLIDKYALSFERRLAKLRRNGGERV